MYWFATSSWVFAREWTPAALFAQQRIKKARKKRNPKRLSMSFSGIRGPLEGFSIRHEKNSRVPEDVKILPAGLKRSPGDEFRRELSALSMSQTEERFMQELSKFLKATGQHVAQVGGWIKI